MTEFEAWPKTPRLFRDIVITEKIDGTNAAVIVEETDPILWPEGEPVFVNEDPATGFGAWYKVTAQSRNRLITPEQDNAGFARWVQDHALELAVDLGPGRHFGEWYGSKIGRKYGLEEKRLALFNVAKWASVTFTTPNLTVVPTLYSGPYAEEEVWAALQDLEEHGSYAAPGFMEPEGICVFHTASRKVYKVTLDGDGGKWQNESQ